MHKLELAVEAVVIPGYSESTALAEPLKRELCEGQFALFRSVVGESPALADVQAYPRRFEKMFEGKTLVMHSLASILVAREHHDLTRKAKGFIFLNPVEGSSLGKIVSGAVNVAFQKNNDEEDPSYVPPFTQGPRELIRHPIINARNPFKATKYSTANTLLGRINGTDLGSDVPLHHGGYGYFEYDNDEFGFKDVLPETVSLLRIKGLDAARFTGKHMAPIYRPRDTCKQLNTYLNSAQ